MRTKRFMAFFMAMILAFSCAWNLSVNVKAEETEAEYHYYVLTEPGDRTMLTCDTVFIPNTVDGWERTKNDPHGVDKTVTIEKAEISKQTCWEEGKTNVFHLDEVKDEDGKVIGWNLTAAARGEVIINIYGENETLYDTFEVYCKGVEYILYHHYPNDCCDMLPDTEMGIWTELYEYSVNEEGEKTEQQVEEYELSLGEDYDMNLLTAEINGTELNIKSSKDSGETRIPVYVTMPDEKDGTIDLCDSSIFVNVCDDVWKLGFNLSTGTDCILPGKTMEMYADLWRECYNREEDYHYHEDIGNVEYVWESLDSELFAVDENEEDPCIATITASKDAKNNSEGAIRLTVYELDEDDKRVKDDNDNYIELAKRDIYLYVVYGYLVVEPVNVDNVPIGGMLDLTEAAVLKRYTMEDTDNNGTVLEGVKWETEVEGDTWQATAETADNEIPTFVRTNTDGGNIRLIAKLLNEETEKYEEVRHRDYWFDGLDYSFGPNLNDGDRGYVYTDKESYTFDFDMSNLEGKTYHELDVQIGYGDENGEFVPINEAGLFKCNLDDNKNLISITLYPKQIKEYMDEHELGDWFEIYCTTIYKEGEYPVGENRRGIELREAYIEYNHQYWGNSMLPHWEWDLYKNIDYKLNNEEYPNDDYGQVEIIDAKVSVDEGNLDALELIPWEEEEDGSISGWTMKANSFGHAVVTLEHTIPYDDKNTEIHEFEVWIGEDVWSMNLINSNGSEDLLVGDSKQIIANVYRKCYTENKGHFIGDTSGVTYEWGIAENHRDDILDIEQNKENPNIVTVTAKENANDGDETRVYVRAYYTFEDDREEEVYYDEMRVYITNGLWTMTPVAANAGMLVGESGEIEPHLIDIYYEDGEKVNKEVESVSYRLSWDSNAFYVTDSEGNELAMEEDGRSPLSDNSTYHVTRKEAWETNIDIYAYVDGEEVFCRNLHYDELDYKVTVELQNGNNGFVYVDETFTDKTGVKLSLQQDCLAEKESAQVFMEFGYWNDNGEFVVVENSDENTFYEELYEETTEEDKVLTGIKLYPTALHDYYNRAHFNIKTFVKVEYTLGTEETSTSTIVDENYSNIEIADKRCEYDITESIDMLPGWGDDFGIELEYTLYDNEHPYGESGSVAIKDATIKIEEGQEGNEEEGIDPCVTLSENRDENDDLTGWHIQANDGGHAVITLELDDPYGGEEPVYTQIHVYVSDSVWNLHLSSDTGTNDLRPSASMTLTPHISRDCYDYEKQEHYDGSTEGVTYECGSHNGDVAAITVNNEEGTFTVTAKENASIDSETRVWVRAYNADGEEDPYKVAYAEYDIYIRRGYCSVEPIHFNVNIGETKEYNPTTTYMGISGSGEKEENEVDNVYYRFEYDENAVEIYTYDEKNNLIPVSQETYDEEDNLTSDEYKYAGPFVMKRLTNDNEGDIRVVAYQLRTDEESETTYFEEIGDRWYGFDYMDTNLAFGNLRREDENHTVVYFGEEYNLTLADSFFVTGGELSESVEVEWIVGQTDDDGNFTKEYGSEIYSASGATITLNGAAIHTSDEIAGENGNGGFDVRAIFKTKKANGDSVETGIQAQTWVGLDESKIEVADKFGSITNDKTIAYADNKLSVCITNDAYPDGMEKEFTIKDITVDNETVLKVFQEAGSWQLKGLSEGTTKVTYQLCDSDNAKVVFELTKEYEVTNCEHSWKDGDILKEATCTQTGKKEMVCEHCKATKTEEIPSNGHTEVVDAAVAPTCTATGLTEGSRCSVCKTVIKEQKTVAAKGHTEVVIPAVAATETSTGLTQGKKCSVCGTILEKQEVVAKLQPAHKCSYTYVSNNDATVLADGTRIGTCECGKTTGVVTDPGTKLKATIKVPAKSFKMQTKQTYKGFVVTMGKDDYIVSVKSNKTNIVKVSGINKTKGTFTIKAQKKTGKAVVTIKLASGKSQKITITVQKKAVTTTKISGLASKITLVKGKKTTLKPVITPITSKQKVKFKTSNKKVATVSVKGVVLAKKAGKAKITVTSGSKKKTITVTVKNK